MKPPEKIVLLEFPDEVEAYLYAVEKEGTDSTTAKIISLDPSVQLILNQRGINYETSIPYFSLEAHARSLIKSNEVLDWLAARFSFRDSIGIEEAYRNALDRKSTL